MKKYLWIGALFLLLVLTVATRSANIEGIFVGGDTFFIDPDCYSRMTRVQMIVNDPGLVIGKHDFENWPYGVTPHTTAPMDYTIALVVWAIMPFVEKARALDLGGAWTPVLLALITAVFVWIWAGNARWRGARWWVLAFFAISPMLIQATAVGRPDHQALLLPLLAMALGAELALQAGWGHRQRWAYLWGAAWGCALWVSLYEPGILFPISLLLVLILNRRSLIWRERLRGAVVLFLILLLALAIDGWTSPVPDEDVRRIFPNWAQTVAELRQVPLWSPILLQWTMVTLPLTLFILPWVAYTQRDKARPALFALALVIILVALTCVQMRWGFYLSLVFMLSLPWQLAVLPKRGVVVALIFLGIGSLLTLDQLLNSLPGKYGQETYRNWRIGKALDGMSLRHISRVVLAQEKDGAILAPWWHSPALAYWTGLPCVGGSSHQSLGGTLVTSKFYLETDAKAARELASSRKVRYVVVFEPENLVQNSSQVMGIPVPDEEKLSKTMASILFRQPSSPPPGFRYLGGNPRFRAYEIEPLEGDKAPQ